MKVLELHSIREICDIIDHSCDELWFMRKKQNKKRQTHPFHFSAAALFK